MNNIERVSKAYERIKSKKGGSKPELAPLMDTLSEGVNQLNRVSIKEWLEDKKFMKIEVPKYDADTKWEDQIKIFEVGPNNDRHSSCPQ